MGETGGKETGYVMFRKDRGRDKSKGVGSGGDRREGDTGRGRDRM